MANRPFDLKDWRSPDELGLKEAEAEKLRHGTICQLRPLPGGQPFGIFFVEFDQAKAENA